MDLENESNPIRSGSTSLGFMFLFIGVVILALLFVVFKSLTYQNKDALGHIADLKESDEIEERVYSAFRLGELADSTAVPQLIFSLKNDKEKFVRIRCAEALGKMKTTSSVDALIETIKNDTVSDVKIWAIWSIGNLKIEKAIEPLANELNSKNTFVRLNAIQSLGEIGTEKSLSFLENYKPQNTLEDSILQVVRKKFNSE